MRRLGGRAGAGGERRADEEGYYLELQGTTALVVGHGVRESLQKERRATPTVGNEMTYVLELRDVDLLGIRLSFHWSKRS